MNRSNKNLLIIAAIIIAGVMSIWIMVPVSIQPVQTAFPGPQSSSTISATLVITDGTKNLFDAVVPGTATSTVFSLLQTMAASSGMAFAYKNYPGMGYLVTKIGDETNGEGGAYWQYWVNGVYATQSADHMPVNKGDIIIWKFTASQQ